MALREVLIAGSVATLTVGSIAYAQVATDPVTDELATELLFEDGEQIVEVSDSDRDRKRDRKDCDDDDHNDGDDDTENADDVSDDQEA